MDAVIDLHAHILPAVDDGPRDLEAAVALVADAHRLGVRTIAATPHVNPTYFTRPETTAARLDELREAVAAAGIEIELLPGAELDFTTLAGLDGAERAAHGLGGNAQLLLVETPFTALPLSFATTLLELRGDGIIPVLAHPERSPGILGDIEQLRAPIESGTVVQVNAGSLLGRFGRRVQQTAHAIVAAELCHLVASDMHNVGDRLNELDRVAEVLGNPTLARWLTFEVPEALLAGSSLSLRPPPGRLELL